VLSAVNVAHCFPPTRAHAPQCLPPPKQARTHSTHTRAHKHTYTLPFDCTNIQTHTQIHTGCCSSSSPSCKCHPSLHLVTSAAAAAAAIHLELTPCQSASPNPLSALGSPTFLAALAFSSCAGVCVCVCVCECVCVCVCSWYGQSKRSLLIVYVCVSSMSAYMCMYGPIMCVNV